MDELWLRTIVLIIFPRGMMPWSNASRASVTYLTFQARRRVWTPSPGVSYPRYLCTLVRIQNIKENLLMWCNPRVKPVVPKPSFATLYESIMDVDRGMVWFWGRSKVKAKCYFLTLAGECWGVGRGRGEVRAQQGGTRHAFVACLRSD